MALFLTRFKTFVDNVSQILAADMHRLQDELIALNTRTVIDYVFGPPELVGLADGDPCTMFGTGGLVTEQPGASVLVLVEPAQTTAPATSSPTLVVKVLNAAVTTEVYVQPNVDNTGSDSLLGNFDDLLAIYEASVSPSAIGANNVTVGAGLRAPNFSSTVPDTNRRHAMFFRASGDTNWKCSVSDGGTSTVTDSGVAIAANTYVDLRVELHGANTVEGIANGTSGVAIFFIDDVEVHKETDANVPQTTGGGVGPWIGAQATTPGPTADFEFRCPRMRTSWSEL